MDGGAWWAAVHGVAKSRTRLSNFTFSFHFKELNRIYKVLSTRSSEKAMATHSSILARKIPWAEGPDGLQSMGLLEVGHD